MKPILGQKKLIVVLLAVEYT